MNIVKLDPRSPDAQNLIRQSDAYMAALYPSESNHMESVASLTLPNVLFVGIHGDGKLVACGAVKTLDEDCRYGEIKRLFVIDEHRGKGLSRRIMDHLETHLREMGVHVVRLETGTRQPEALGLYNRLGYARRGPFGAYGHDPLSVFMEKHL